MSDLIDFESARGLNTELRRIQESIRGSALQNAGGAV